MVIKLTNKPAYPLTNAAQVRFSPRFGGTSTEVVQKAAENIPNIKVARKLKDVVNALGLNKDVRVGGLSLEDVSGRLQTAIGVYLLQGYYAVKDDKHPYETNGRNAIVWLMTLALTSLTKSEKFGVNTLLLNPIMNKKGTHATVPLLQSFVGLFSKDKANKYIQPIANKTVQPVLDLLRMDVDYQAIIKEAGIKMSDAEKLAADKGSKALWASSWLDSNRIEQIQNLEARLTKKITDKTITAEEKLIHDAIPGFFRRINAFNIASTAIITAATVYLIGGVAMKIVNRVFTPLDKDGKGKDKPNVPPFFSPNSYVPPRPRSTTTFPQALPLPVSPQLMAYRSTLPIAMPQAYGNHNISPNYNYPVMLPNHQGGLN